MLCVPVFAEFHASTCSSSPVENVDVTFTMVGRRVYVAPFVHRPTGKRKERKLRRKKRRQRR
jgi:hypothetical protein